MKFNKIDPNITMLDLEKIAYINAQLDETFGRKPLLKSYMEKPLVGYKTKIKFNLKEVAS